MSRLDMRNAICSDYNERLCDKTRYGYIDKKDVWATDILKENNGSQAEQVRGQEQVASRRMG